MDIKRSVLSGSFWAISGTIAHQLIGFAVFVYLARVLSPHLFGIVAMAVAFGEIAAIICRFGQTNAIVRLEKVNDRMLSTSFWILFSMGFISTVLLSALSGPISFFYQEPDLKWIMVWFAPLPMIGTIGAVHDALIQRKMQFHIIAFKNVSAMICSGGVAIMLAYLDFGVGALIGQRLTFNLISSVILMACSRWHPKLIFDKKESRYLLSHGKSVTYNVLSNRLSPRLTDLFVGFFLGAHALGLLRIANQTFEFIVLTTIQPVSEMLPAILRHYQNNKESLTLWFSKLSQIASIVIFPALIGSAVIADDLILVIFGSKWTDSAMIIKILCLQFLIIPIVQFSPPTMMAIGEMAPVSALAICRVILTAIIIPLCCQFGLVCAVVGLVLVQYVISAAYFHALFLQLPKIWPKLIADACPPFLSVAIMSISVLSLNFFLVSIKFENSYLKLFYSIICGVISYSSFIIIGDLIGLWKGAVMGLWELIRALLETKKVR